VNHIEDFNFLFIAELKLGGRDVFLFGSEAPLTGMYIIKIGYKRRCPS